MKKVKWFFGEFFVVVAGVLVAFVLNGWWLSMKEAQKEQDYLQYIHSDLCTTLDIVEDAESHQRKALHGAFTLLRASYSHNLKNDTDLPLHLIRSLSFAPTAQVSATLASLVATGDLQLITNDSLRRNLSQLLTSLEGYEQSNSDMGFLWLVPAIENFADVVNIADLRFQILDSTMLAGVAEDSLSGFPAPLDLLRPDPVDISDLITKPEFRSSLIKLQIAHHNLYSTHKELKDQLAITRKMLEREMHARSIAFAESTLP